MDTEQLQLLLNTVSAAGEGAFVIAILWLSKSIVITLILVGGLLLVVHKIATLVLTNNAQATTLSELAALVNMHGFSPFFQSDLTALKDKLSCRLADKIASK